MMIQAPHGTLEFDVAVIGILGSDSSILLLVNWQLKLH